MNKIYSNLSWLLRRDILYIVYQFGKVGSSSIFHDLLKRRIPAVYTHNHAEASKIIKDHSHRKIVVISGVREPIARNISAFFQNFENLANPFWYLGTKQYIESMPVYEIVERFHEFSFLNTETVLRPWFKRYADATGIDVSQFEYDSGVYVMKRGNLHSVVYTLEKFSSFESYYQNNLLLTPDVKAIPKKNVASTKWFRDIYQKFVEKVCYTDEEYNRRYGRIDFLNRFYSENELVNAKQRFIR